MKIDLGTHQLKAINLLNSGSILCGGVGTGKSRTAIAYYFINECGGKMNINGVGEYKPMKTPKDLYIITTAKKRDTLEWEKECCPFLITKEKTKSVSSVNLIIDSWNNIKKYTKVKKAFFIFDEQRLVGSGTWVKSFLKIVKHNRWILLSATPGDTWNDYIPVFVANNFYKNRTEFLRRHAVYNRFTKYPKVEKYIENNHLSKLRAKITVEMPYEKHTIAIDKTIHTQYNKEVFKKALVKRWNVFENKPIKNISELCYILRKIVNSDPSRIIEVEKIIKQHPRLIIFYNFDYELELLRTVGKKLKLTTAEWNGHKHEDVPKNNTWLYLVQYTAGAEGWNCVSTDAILFYSQNYSYKTMVQAAGRIDRLNTPYTNLYYYHLRSTSEIDIAIARSLKIKKNFNITKFIKEGG